MAAGSKVICGRRTPVSFCARDWTAQISLKALEKFARTRKAGSGLPPRHLSLSRANTKRVRTTNEEEQQGDTT
jgi:hypothetical protein